MGRGAGIPLGAAAVAALAAGPLAAQDDAAWRRAREAMVAEQLVSRRISDSATLAAMRTVPRHLFVPESKRVEAYEDYPLPIGWEATISQPFIVALMTELVRPRPGQRVLEIGTGSGYQAAVLATTGCRVWTVEIVEELASQARERLRRLGYGAVEVRHGDGYLGWPEAAPFDAIVVTAAADAVPPALIAQLAPGGRLVMPVGDLAGLQVLTLIEKDAAGAIRQRRVEYVRFVPLRRAP